MVSRVQASIGIALAFAIGVAASYALRTGDAERAASLSREIDAARAAAADASAEHDTLVAEVARLEAALAAAHIQPTPSRDVAGSPHEPTSADGESNQDREAERDDPGVIPSHGMLGSFDPDRLVAAGFHRQDVERFRARLDEIEMKRLYLRDQAARENWADTPRFIEESRALLGELAGLRAEFDDPLYDWMLYSAGHPNRVAVQSVLAGSAGESAGLARGDLIVRYDGRLVLSAAELRDATITGRAGEWVAIDVQRAGETSARRILVPRGPIGVTLAPTIVEPPPAG